MGQEIFTVDSNRSRCDIKTDEHLLPTGRSKPPAAAAHITLIRSKAHYLQLTSEVSQQFRVHALTAYGLLAAARVLGVKGVSVLLLHLGLSFCVALLRKPLLSWACNLLLLSTLYVQPLQHVQVGFIRLPVTTTTVDYPAFTEKYTYFHHKMKQYVFFLGKSNNIQ